MKKTGASSNTSFAEKRDVMFDRKVGGSGGESLKRHNSYNIAKLSE